MSAFVHAHGIKLSTQGGGGGQKLSIFVHAQGIKTVHSGGGSKNSKIMST